MGSTEESIVPIPPDTAEDPAGMTGGVQSARVRQGAKDVRHGLVDTSRAPEADHAYRRLKR